LWNRVGERRDEGRRRGDDNVGKGERGEGGGVRKERQEEQGEGVESGGSEGVGGKVGEG